MENLTKIFLLIGSAAGVYSFIRLVGGDIFTFFNRANLVIRFDSSNDIKQWRIGPPYLQNEVTREVVTVHIHNKGKKPAKDCEAFIEIINGNKDVKKMLPLHWADTPYNALSTSIEKVKISKLHRRLDIVFTQYGQNINGCCIASAQALAAGPQQDQFFLPEGEYEIKIHINYNSGKSIARKFIIKSPKHWQDLWMDIA